jgi:heavy metal sensor kinase
VLAVVLAAFGASVYWMMGGQLMNRLDDGLREELSDVLGEVERATEREAMLYWLDRRFAGHEGFDFQITAPDGTRIFSNPRLGERWLPIPGSLPREQNVFTEVEAEDRRWRVINRMVTGPDSPLTVQVARSLEPYDHEMGELLAVLLITGPAALIAALSGGYFLAGKALAPVERMTATANEITAQRLDRRLEVTNRDDELGRLAETINGMIERLERSFREMQRFTADASHELRTPIAILRTEAEVALGKPMDDAEKQNLLGNFLEECERLGHITEQLLTLSREDAGIGRTVREPVDLAAMASEVAEVMRPLADAKGLRLQVKEEAAAIVQGDPHRLRHVFYNLLDNAIKYTPEGGQVEVTTESADSTVHLTVHDSGIGIPAEHLPYVFDRFYRTDESRDRAAGGAGLGLAIAKGIVEAHGGTISAASEPGRGATFTFTLPACPDA